MQIKCFLSCTLLLCAALSVNAKETNYIRAKINIMGEFHAESDLLLEVGKPSRMKWTESETGVSNYTLLIPSPMSIEDKASVFALLLKQNTKGHWEVVAEQNSMAEEASSLLNIENNNITMTIEAELSSKHDFLQDMSVKH